VEHFEQILTKLGDVFLMGDFNLNVLNSDSHSKTGEFIDLLYSSSFCPLIDKPTRVTETTSSLIDNIFCNRVALGRAAGILYTDVSDHLPLFVIDGIHDNQTVIAGLHRFRKFSDDAKLSN
jgi:endonuclease/exonuclease/phosphatase family metal-dependent hydrolase